MKLILITGLQRSVSTWLFNITRELLDRAHLDFESCYSDELSPEIIKGINKKKFIIVKSHLPHKNLTERADLIFASYRKPADAINSFHKSFNVPLHQAKNALSESCRHLMNLEKKVVNFKYEDLFFNKVKIVKKISGLMGLSISDEDIFQSIFNQYTKEKVTQKISRLTENKIINSNDRIGSCDPIEHWHFNHTRIYDHKKLTIKEDLFIFMRFASFYKSKYPLFYYYRKSIYYGHKILRHLVHRLARFRQVNFS
jgi:hypothetical protein